MPWIDIDLREIDDDDLLSELENRYLNEDEKLRLIRYLNKDPHEKLKFFISVMDKYSLMELENMFKETFPITPIPKEQLKLELK